eukprot:IDg6583t1
MRPGVADYLSTVDANAHIIYPCGGGQECGLDAKSCAIEQIPHGFFMHAHARRDIMSNYYRRIQTSLSMAVSHLSLISRSGKSSLVAINHRAFPAKPKSASRVVKKSFVEDPEAVGTCLAVVPKGCTSVLQTYDDGIDKPFKIRLQSKRSNWNSERYASIGASGKISNHSFIYDKNLHLSAVDKHPNMVHRHAHGNNLRPLRAPLQVLCRSRAAASGNHNGPLQNWLEH